MIDINTTSGFLIAVASLFVVVGGIGIIAGFARGNFGKAMTKSGIIFVGIFFIGLGALGGPALVKVGQSGGEQIGVNANATGE